MPGSLPVMLFDELATQYLDTARFELRSVDRAYAAFKPLLTFFSGRPAFALSRVEVAAYISFRRHAGLKNQTINRELFTLSAAYRFANRNLGVDFDSPAKGMYLREPEGRVRYLQKDEAVRLVSVARARGPEWLPDFILIALHTGCRKNELLTLSIASVDIEGRRFLLESHLTKTGKRRYIPMNQSAFTAMERRVSVAQRARSDRVFCLLNGMPARSVLYYFKLACEGAGIEDFRIHDLRHTCASWLVSAGVPLYEVKELLGHATIRQTERYAHLAPNRLREAVDTLAEFVK